MKEESLSERRLTLNSITDFLVKEENVFEDFKIVLASEDVKAVRCWIDDNMDVLNGTFGKKLETPLHNAVQVSNKEAVTELISSGALVDIPNISGLTALHTVCQTGETEIARMIFCKAPDLRVKNNKYVIT